MGAQFSGGEINSSSFRFFYLQIFHGEGDHSFRCVEWNRNDNLSILRSEFIRVICPVARKKGKYLQIYFSPFPYV